MANDLLSKYVKSSSKKVRQATSKSNSWISNALKSVGYSSFDVLTELMPATVDVAKTTATVGADIATSISKSRNSDRSLKSAMEHNFYSGLGKDLLKNSLEDLKSGKFYNKERLDQYYASMDDGTDDFDFNFDDDENFDTDEFDDSIDSADGMAHASFSRKKGKHAEATNIVIGTNLGPDSTLVKATEFQTETCVNVGRAVIDNSRDNSRAMMTMMGGLRNEVNASLSSIGDNISTVAQVVSESLGKHMTLSAKYYEDSISLQTQILEHLKNHATGTTTNTKQFKEYNNVLDIITSGGALDFNAYKALVKKQANNYVDNNMLLSQLKFMNDNKEAMQMSVMSPFQKTLENGIKSLIPKAMQTAMTAFDEQLKETTTAALNQVSGLQRSNNPLLSAIGQIFGIQNKLTISRVDKSAYNKGAMSWSGVDHQALTNVIPTLLRKIYASISGTQEIGFDYNRGVFRNVKEMEEEAANDKLRRETSGYSDYKSRFREFLNHDATFSASRAEKKKYSDDFDKIISKLVRDSYGGRTFRKGGRTGKQKNANGDELDDIRDLLGARSSDDKNVQVIRSYFKYLERTDKAALTRFFGNGLQEQRAALDKQNREIQNDPIKYNTMYMDTGLNGSHKTDSHLEFKDENNKSRVTGVKNGVAAGVKDKYGRDSNYYLRNILSTLTTGIYVVPIGGLGDTTGPIDPEVFKSFQNNKSKVEEAFKIDTEKKSKNDKHNRLRPDNFSDERRQKEVAKGKFDINEDFDPDLVAMSAAADDESRMNKDDRTFIGKVMDKVPEDSGLGRILSRIRNSSNKMGEKGTGIFNKLNDALFDVVFGDGEGRKGAGAIFNKAMGVLKSGFRSFSTFLDNKIFKPLDNALFGEDGFVNKLKQSDFGQKMSEIFNTAKSKASSFFLGDLDAEGNRSGGLFSETVNSLKDIGKQVKSGILGEKGPDGKPLPLDQDNSVLGNLKRMFKGVTSNIGTALGIEKSDEPFSTKISNAVDSVFHRISDRASEWSDNIFGRKDKDGNELNTVFNSEFASQFKEDMKGQKGFIGATSAIGLLGSFFLPGGPIGGALVGAGVGIVSKSSGLKDLLFGPEDENNERVGGIINKEVQDFFKNNKTGISVGAIGGMASSIGLLPSFFLPGGPIGGALIGSGVSMIAKSGAFNTLLYGEGGTKEDPTGGLMANFKKAFGKDKSLKNVGLDAGIGAGVGLLGSFFLPGGPIIHALLGSALSVGTATDKFKDWFFGEAGEDGKRSGGMFGRFSDYMKDKIFSPLSTSVKLAQSHIMGFVEENMVLPFKYAIDPLVKEAKHAKDVIGQKISNVFESFKTSLNDRVVKPIGDTIDKYLITPIKNTLSRLFSGLGGIVGTVISAPFKMIGGMGWNAYDKQKKRGREEYINSAGRDDKSFFGRIKGGLTRLGMRAGFVDREGVKAAQYSESGASYEADQEIERRQRYNDELEEIRARREAEREAIRNGLPIPSKSSKRENTKDKSVSTNIKTSKDTGSTRVDTSSPKDKTSSTRYTGPTLSKDQKKAYKNAYKEAYDAGFRGDDLREYVNLFRPEPDKSGKTKVSTGGKTSVNVDLGGSSSKQENTKDKSVSTNIKTSKDTGSTRVDTSSPKDSSSKVDTSSKRSSSSEKSSSGRTKDEPNKLLKLIQKDVSKISDSVYGQLNGVGSNVNKIYRLLLKRFGKKDEDIKGDNNKEYVGFFGKLRTALNNPMKALKSAIATPLNAAKKIITTPFKKIADIGHGIALSITKVGSGIKKAGKIVISGLGDFAKGIGRVTIDLLKLPLDVLHTGLSVVRAALPALGEAVKEGVKVIGTGLEIAGNVLVTGVQTVGYTLAGAAQGFGQLVGGALSGLGSIFSAFGLIGKDALKGIWSGIKFVGSEAFNIGKSVLSVPGNIISSIADRIGGGKGGKKGSGLFGKGPVHVIVDSGVLDRVKVVDLVKKIGSKGGSDSSSPSPKPSSPLSGSSGVDTRANDSGTPVTPLNLQFFGKKQNDDGNNTSVSSNKDKFNTAVNAAKDKLKSVKDTIRDKLKRKDDAEHDEQVKRGSRSSLLSRLNAADAKEEESNFRGNLLANILRGANAAEEHKNSFMGVFDLKKGLITAGIIALAPFIIKLFKKFDIGGLLTSLLSSVQTGFSEVGGIAGVANNVTETTNHIKDTIKRQDTHYVVDEDGNFVYDENGNPVKETTKTSRISALLTPTKTRINTETGEWENRKTWTGKSDSLLNFVGHRKLNANKNALKYYELGKKIGTGIRTVGEKVFGSNSTKSATAATTAKNTARVTFENAKGKASEAIKKVVNGDGIISKAITMMKKALDLLVSKFKTLGERYGVKIGESTLGTILKSVRKIFDPKKLSRYSENIEKFVMKITKKSTVSAATFMIADVGFALYGAIDGASNAGALFEVNSSDVDGKMRAIAAVFKGLLNTSIGSWVDLINSLVYEILGFNFIKTIASHVYKLISSNQDTLDLEEAQDQFTKEYEASVEEEYNAYVENTQSQGQTPMSFDDFKASDLSTTRSEYNSEVNKSFAKKVYDKIHGVGKGIKDTGSTVVSGITSAGSSVFDKGKEMFGNVGESISKVATQGVEAAKGIVTGFANIKSTFENKDNDFLDYFKADVNPVSEDNAFHGLVGGALNISKFFMFPKLVVFGLLKKVGSAVGGAFKGVIDTVADTGNTIVSGVKKLGSLAVNGDFVNVTNYEGVDETANPIAPFGNAILGASKLVYTPIAVMTSVGKKAADFIKTTVGKFTDFGSNVTSFISKLNDYTDPDKSLSGWDNESMGSDDDPVASIASTIIKKVMWVYVGIVRSIKGAFDWVGDTASGIKDTVVSGLSTAKDAVGGFVNKIGTTIMNIGRGGEDGGRPIGGKGGSTELNGTPYYSQNDPRYKNKPYKETGGKGSSDDTIGERGCGPTAMAMVASKATGKNYDPTTMAKMAEAGGYSTSVGTTPGYFGAAANTLGIANRRDVPTADNLAGSLANGNSVILQGVRGGKNNSPYTSEGHYVTATGINGDNVIINDPRGREYSGEYKMSDVMNDTVGMWSFDGGTGGFGSPKKPFYKRKGIIGGFGTSGDLSTWLNIVREVKKAIAAQRPGYSQSRFIKITVGGKTLSVRTDCSGYVGACLKYFGVLSESANLTSSIITNKSDGTMSKTGFTPGGWPGWDSLQEGDILARNGHTEIFAYNKDGKHYVYNCGSDRSVNSAVPTTTGHPNGYTTVWRCGSAGTGVVTGSASVDGSVGSTDGSTSSGGASSISDVLSGAASAVSNSIMEGLGIKTESSSSDTSSVTTMSDSSIEAANLSGSSNAQKIWNYFKSQGLTSAGTAGLMGNMQQESGLNPTNLQNSYEKKLGYTDQSYTSAVDNGSYNNFVNDKAGYGLVQWTYHSLKQQLLNYKKQTGKSIGDLGMQLGFLAHQLQSSYPSVWSTLKSTSSITDATNKVMLDFEKPGDQSTAAKSKRAGFSKAFYNTYAGGNGGNDGGRPIKPTNQLLGGYGNTKRQKVSPVPGTIQDTSSSNASKIIERKSTTRSASTDDMAQLLKLVVEYLSEIADNTETTTSELETLNSKDLGTSNITNNTIASTNNSFQSKSSGVEKAADRSGYDMAKRVAAGILS